MSLWYYILGELLNYALQKMFMPSNPICIVGVKVGKKKEIVQRNYTVNKELFISADPVLFQYNTPFFIHLIVLQVYSQIELRPRNSLILFKFITNNILVHRCIALCYTNNCMYSLIVPKWPYQLCRKSSFFQKIVWKTNYVLFR